MSSLDDARRLAAIEQLNLLDGRRDVVLDSATRLASRLVGAPVSLVSIVTDDRQVFTSQVGLPTPGETPLSHSFCRLVVLGDEPLRVTDANSDPRVRGNPVIEELKVVAYFGVPLHAPGGETIGSFCVIDDVPREWTDEDLAALRDVADLVEHVLRSRHATSELLGTVEARDNLVATLVHDIRQPLSGARLASDLLARRWDKLEAAGRRDEVVDTLHRQVVQVDRLLGELVEREGDGPEDVDLREIAEDLRRQAAVSRDGEVVVAVPPGTTVRAPRADVGRVLSNLVRNALVHGGVGVTATIHAERVAGGVLVEVADDGIGLPDEDLKRIFAFGEQGAGHGSGSGIGLHVVRTIVRRGGGDVTVASELGVGTTFRVELRDIAEGAEDAA